MCTKPKVTKTTIETIKEKEKGETEVIKEATQADASKQKAGTETRLGRRGLISANIRTTNNGIEDEIDASKKKLLGE